MQERSNLNSMFTFHCPHCHDGHLYEVEKIYTFRNMGGMHDKCEKCGTNFKPEPGFYFGAAYVNWGLTVALWFSVFVALKVFDAFGWIEYSFLGNPVTLILSGLGVTIVLFPYMFRLSRSIWAHIFIK